MKKLILGLFISVLMVFLCNTSVIARETVTVELPKVIVTSNYNNTDNFYVSLERLKDSYPMPSTSRISTVMITGNNDNTLGTITFNEDGIYEYRVYQDKKNLKNVSYDNAVYYLTIQIKNDKIVTILKKSGSTEKEKSATFVNTYNNTPSDDQKDDVTPADDTVVPSNNKSNSKSKSPAKSIRNPYTADAIAKYFIISIISVLLILIIIIYVKNSKEDD